MSTLRNNARRARDPGGLDLAAQRVAKALRAAASLTDPADSFRPVLNLAIHTGNWDVATVSMLTGDGSLETVASAADSLVRAAQFQHDLGDGPGLAAIKSSALIAVRDIARDSRWPGWAHVAKEIGVTAAVSAPLATDVTIGALNLYRLAPSAGDVAAGDVVAAELLAAHASVLLTHVRAMQNLRGAIDTRNVIGQAQGILMERYRLSPSTAFAVLRRTSNQCNSRVVAVAEELIATGSLPRPDRFGGGRTGAVTSHDANT